MSRVRLFGCVHTNTRSVVESDLREFAAGVDAFAIENPVFDSPREALFVMLQLPVVTIGLNVVGLLIQLPMFIVGHRDIVQVELPAVASVSGDRPVHGVDRHPLGLVADRGWPAIAGNWVVFLAGLVIAPVSTAVLVGLSAAVSIVITVRRRYGYRWLSVTTVVGTATATVWLLVAGYLNPLFVLGAALLSIAVLKLTLGARNDVMLDEVDELVDEHGYEEVCLLTGRAHVTGMLDIAESLGVEVTDAFKQRWRQSGFRVGPDGDPLDHHDPVDSTADAPESADTSTDLLEKRAAAAVVDWLPVLTVLVVASVALASVYAALAPFAAPELAEWGFATAMAAATLGVPLAYHTVCEGLWDQTLGKRVVGLRVVQVDGSSVPPSTAFIRALGGLFDFLPVGYLLGLVVASRDDDGRRLGDKMAGTVVVRDADARDG